MASSKHPLLSESGLRPGGPPTYLPGVTEPFLPAVRCRSGIVDSHGHAFDGSTFPHIGPQQGCAGRLNLHELVSGLLARGRNAGAVEAQKYESPRHSIAVRNRAWAILRSSQIYGQAFGTSPFQPPSLQGLHASHAHPFVRFGGSDISPVLKHTIPEQTLKSSSSMHECTADHRTEPIVNSVAGTLSESGSLQFACN